MYDYDVEEWEECDCCHVYKAQVETAIHLVQQVVVTRRSTRGIHDHLQVAAAWDHRHVGVEERERLCFHCYIVKHGSDSLGEKKVFSWADQRSESHQSRNWEQDEAERNEELSLRELNWQTRHIDMFENQRSGTSNI